MMDYMLMRWQKLDRMYYQAYFVVNGSPYYWAGYRSALSNDLGLDFSNPTPMLTPSERGDDSEQNKQDIKYKIDYIDSNGHRFVKITDIKVDMKFDSYRDDLENVLSFTLYEINTDYYHDDDSADIIYDDEILFQSNLVLKGNYFEFQNRYRAPGDVEGLYEGSDAAGVFSERDFLFTLDDDGFSHISYQGPTVKIIDLGEYFPTTEEFASAPLSFNSSGDCKANERARFNTLALETSSQDQGTNIYPIPAANTLHVNVQSLEKVELSTYTSAGQRIPSEIQKTGNGKYEIDISRFAPGVYYLLVLKNGKQSLHKFSK